MTTPQELYPALKSDLGALAGPLFAQSEKLLVERGDFLPHAAVLNAEGKVALLGAMCLTPDGFANSWHILPIIHEGLRSMASERTLTALGVAESVTQIPGAGATRAIKVLLEHSLGLNIAFYMPFMKNDAGHFVFGKTISLFVEPEINAWPQNAD